MQDLPDDGGRAFFENLLKEMSHEIRHSHGREQDILFTIQELDPRNFEELSEKLLKYCIEYNQDEYTVREICNHLHHSIFQNEKISNLLITNIKDQNMTNTLRENFFRVFSSSFKENCKKFYLNDLGNFLKNNSENHELVKEILDDIQWSFDKKTLPPNLKNLIRNFLRDKTEMKKNLNDNLRKLLEIKKPQDPKGIGKKVGKVR